MAEIRVENLHKAFGEFVAVQDSNFTVEDGEFFVMLGPSGCGKTTTLRMIAGLELPTSGSILLGGEDVTFNRAAERDIAFVFQLFALYPHMNVRKNIGFPLKCQGMPAAEIRQRVEETAQLPPHRPSARPAGLAACRRRPPARRARPRHRAAADGFLMDEPLGTLDTEFRDLMVRELRELHIRINATTVYVTHDQLEAMSMADKIAVMNRGVIEQFGTPQEIYDRPATMFVADFIGSPPMNFLPFRAGLRAGARERAASTAPRSPCRSSREDLRRDRARARRPARAHPLRRSLAAARHGLRRRVSRHHPDRHRHHRARPGEGARPRRRAGADRARSVGLALRPERLSLFDAARAAPLRTRAARGTPPWLRSSLARRHQALRHRHRGRRDGPDHRRRRVRRAARPDRRRQDDDAAPRRRAREGRRRTRSRIGGRDVTALDPAARDVAFVFQQYLALPASHASTTTSPSRSARRRAACREAEIKRRVEEIAKMLRIDDKLAEPRDAALRRRDAARRHRPRAGAPAVDLPDGRAALLARRQAARRPPARAEAHPGRARRDHALRHPRPDRGHDHGQPHRRHRRRAGWSRSARRARSTPTRATSMSRPGSASRRST